ncbi:flagellar protein FliT [Robertmurraya korlensis]|uniref:flagellar protein FliT n=1 Tax=Robertmurraya korlensis TaxID=519977 RepID=UPI00203AAB25|nr:flagellar protein FliT [Robertmurraya korlensis]MCM3602638.1 flagellar protein FliT [Robertmurraya korlensis]
MNGLQLFLDLTVQLIKLYQTDGDRDERIQETERLLALRDEAMKNAVPPSSDVERELLRKSKKLNDHLNGLMLQEKQNIQKDMKDLKVKKESTNKYVNPYENFNPDGMFYDRKK